MRQEIIESFSVDVRQISRFSFFERLVIQHAKPIKPVLHIIAAMWALYFLWHQEWQLALVTSLALSFVGTALAWNSDPEELIQTPLGKWFYTMVNPTTLTLQTLGSATIAYGTWMHDGLTVLAGVTLTLLAYAFGWDRLDQIRR